jgi:hypothetical protein
MRGLKLNESKFIVSFLNPAQNRLGLKRSSCVVNKKGRPPQHGLAAISSHKACLTNGFIIPHFAGLRFRPAHGGSGAAAVIGQQTPLTIRRSCIESRPIQHRYAKLIPAVFLSASACRRGADFAERRRGEFAFETCLKEPNHGSFFCLGTEGESSHSPDGRLSRRVCLARTHRQQSGLS